MFGFDKKRKSFTRGFAGRYSARNYARDARESRIFHHRLSAIKAYFLKFMILAALAALAYLFLFSSAFEVKNIAIDGNKTIDAGAIRETVSAIAEKKALNIFKNNLFLIKASDVENAVKDRFGGVSGVSVVKSFPQTLKIEITEKPIDISWCNRIKIERAVMTGNKLEKNTPSADSVPKKSMETAQCYFSDENNVIYEKASDEFASGSIRIFKDDAINIGDKISDDALKNFIRELAGNFDRKTGLSLDYFYLPALSSRELHLITKDGWKIYFDLNRRAGDQLWVLSNTLKNKIPDSDKKNMDYIDLRVIDRVNYMLKQ